MTDSHPLDTSYAYANFPENINSQYYDVTAGTGSSMVPLDIKDKRGQFDRAFVQLYIVQAWLRNAQFTKFNKIAERDRVIAQLQDILLIGKDCFDRAHAQPVTGVPTRTSATVDEQGRTVIVLYDNTFNHFYQQMQSLFLTSASGKQAPASGQVSKQSAATESIGDVQALPLDGIRAFQMAIPHFLEALREAPPQSSLNRRFGWTPGTAFRSTDEVSNISEF